MTGLAELLYYMRQTLGGFYAELFIGIGILIVGVTLGSLVMFWLIAFVSTRIRRDVNFPKDHVTTLSYEIGGKRVIKAPYTNNVKESMVILMDAILLTLFKWKTVQYKSETKNRVAFYMVTGLVMLLTLGSFVSTTNALVGGVKNEYHRYIVMGNQNTKKNNPAPVAARTTETATSDLRHFSVHQSDPSVDRNHTAGNATVAERDKGSENRKETGHKSVKHLAAAKSHVERVEVDGHPVMDTEDSDKVASVVKNAVSHGAREVRVTTQSTVQSVEGTVKSVEGTVKSVEGTVQSVEGTVKSVEGTVKSVGGAVKSVGGAVKSVGGLLRGQNDNGQ